MPSSYAPAPCERRRKVTPAYATAERSARLQWRRQGRARNKKGGGEGAQQQVRPTAPSRHASRTGGGASAMPGERTRARTAGEARFVV